MPKGEDTTKDILQTATRGGVHTRGIQEHSRHSSDDRRRVGEIRKGEITMSNIQMALDEFLRSTPLRTVTDLEYIAVDEVVKVSRKMGRRNCIIDISEDRTPEDVVNHLKGITAIY